MGSYGNDRGGTGGGGTGDEQDAEPDDEQAQVDDFQDESGNEELGGEGGAGSAAGAAGAAGAGAGAGAAAGGASGGGMVEPPESEECEPDEEEPEDSEVDEPDSEEREDSDPEETEERDDEREEADDEESEDDGEDDEEEEDEDDDETVTVSVTVDPLSALSWGIQPVLKRVLARYDDVELEYQLAPVRTFENPDAMKRAWEEGTQLHGMPVDPSFWENPPESTELLNRAVLAAQRQDAMEAYLHRLWIEGIACGRNLSDEDRLVDVARQLGLDAERFRDDLASVEPSSSSRDSELPVTRVPIRGYTQSWEGYVHYTDFQEKFIFAGMGEGLLPPVARFVDEHGPVTTPEIMEVYQWSRPEALDKLRAAEQVVSRVMDELTLWSPN